MKEPLSHRVKRREFTISFAYMLTIGAVSLGAIGSTFGLSLYPSEMVHKAEAFIAIVAAYLAALVVTHRIFVGREAAGEDAGQDDAGANIHLRMLDEAMQCLAGSITTADTFRLIASRVAELAPNHGLSLLLLDAKREHFVVTQGMGTIYDEDSEISHLVDRCQFERDVIIDTALLAAATPLKRGTDVFGMLVISFANKVEARRVEPSILDAIGERAGPLFLASIARERSQENALTDPVTDLPNERAFHLVLENQVAESARKGSNRPLTILSLDIKDFESIKTHHGQTAHDRVLNFVASCVQNSIRQMDFFARGRNDELLVAMPTASMDITDQVIARIDTSLDGRKIKVSDTDACEIGVNFGAASFGIDGETSTALLAVARERREQAKNGLPGSVLWFPQNVTH